MVELAKVGLNFPRIDNGLTGIHGPHDGDQITETVCVSFNGVDVLLVQAIAQNYLKGVNLRDVCK